MAEGTTQHPLKIYFQVWTLLFVFSAFSYMVDWYQFQGYVRWGLILFFMMVKAGLICAIFMHMWWERLAIKLAILLPCFAILVFVYIMWHESYYTLIIRKLYFLVTGS
jgi:cytochrome c oxidase subunit 4|tara:strand:- start:199 stop:522 length:324 start_codon:yes stop_codon:yes gene_type:complete